MQAVIIGSSGFVGRALAQHLAAAGDQVLCLDRIAPHELPAGARFDQIDVCRNSLVLGPTPDAVFYLAQSSAYRDFPMGADELFGVNTYGAVRACAAARSARARFFLYASSGNVYAPSFEPLDEESPLRRDDPYAVSKLAAEDALALFREYPAICCVRLFGVFGPGQENMLPVALRRRIERGEAVELMRSPVDPRDREGLRVSFCYVDDVVRAMRQLAQRALDGHAVPRALNVAGPEGISIRRFAVNLGRVLGREPQFVQCDKTRPHDLVADISRLQNMLRFNFTPLEQALEASVK